MEHSCSSSSVARLLVFALALGAISSTHPAVPLAAEPRGDDGAALTVVRLRWKGQDGAVSLAVDTRDISLAGFSNGSHHWHAFPGHEHAFGGAATTLPFGGDSYRDLIGGLANLPDLPLGPAAGKQAARALSAYDPSAADAAAVAALGAALATLKVMTCEALRLRPVMEAMSRASEAGEAHVSVAREHLPLIKHWDAICYELLRARRTGQWDGPFTELLREHAGIRGEEDALAVVGVLKERTLAEVLMAHARSA